jgi:hypothetical protein
MRPGRDSGESRNPYPLGVVYRVRGLSPAPQNDGVGSAGMAS